jgi:hypothetical protein
MIIGGIKSPKTQIATITSFGLVALFTAMCRLPGLRKKRGHRPTHHVFSQEQ